jgi:hypothetical protein
MKIKIHVTKDVLRRSALCGMGEGSVIENCMVACAVRDIFPNAVVGKQYELDDVATWNISPFGVVSDDDAFFQSVVRSTFIPIPKAVVPKIQHFDSLRYDPSARLDIEEFSFEVTVPTEVIDKIGISSAYKILSESKTLELIQP